MSNVVVKEDIQIEAFSASLPVTRNMLENLQEQRKLLKEFVQSQLVKDVDYGIIPGTKKPSLFKPGAEKLRGLFGLNVPTDCTFQTIDGEKNFAMFTYKAKVFRGDNLVSECEGSTNSQEQKYKERKVWRYDEKLKRKVEIKESTPIYDVLNTLQKMAQKRAFVGAIILATGAGDFFTQDIDEPEDARNIGTIPRVEDGPSQIPKVVNVTSQPVENNQNGESITVEAVVTMEDRQMAKDAGFRWNAAIRKWTKSISVSDFGSFPFEVKEIK